MKEDNLLTQAKVAVIGLGPMGLRHLQTIELSDRLELVAGVDLDREKLEAAGDKFRLPPPDQYTDYRMMVEQTKPDIVVISTNGPSHEAIFHELVSMGIRKVLCEKPIATSISAAERMIRTAQEQGIQLLINHSRRWSRDYISLNARLKNGLIGEVESMLFSMGGGQLGCNGTHIIDLIHYLMESDTASMVGILSDKGTPNPRGKQFFHPGGIILGRLRNGKRYYFEMTEDLGTPPFIVINGTYGRIVIEETKKFYTVERRTQENWALPITRYGSPLSDVERVTFDHFDGIELNRVGLEALAEGKVLLDPAHALAALEVVVAVHHSSEQGERNVQLPLEDETVRERVFSFT